LDKHSLTKVLFTLGITAALLLSPVAKSKDLDEGDPFCNVRIATATSYQSHKTPKDILKLKTQLASNGIKSELALLDRAPDRNRRAVTDWFLTVYPADASKARRLVDAARRRGLQVEPALADPHATISH
jgi:hypothetical protein